jgi:hypothetical protein
VLCGPDLKKYLYKLGFPQKDVNEILDTMRSGKWKYLTFAIDYRGKALEWDGYSADNPPLGEFSRVIAHHLIRNYRRVIYKVELWEIVSPECIKLIDSKGMLGMIGRGLEIM